MNQSSREEVYKAIDAERDCQDITYPNHKHEVSGYLILLDKYLKKANADWVTRSDEASLDEIRKIAALAVACMEEHGVIERGYYNGQTQPYVV